MPKRLYSLLIILLFTTHSFAQYNKLGTWALATVVMPGDSLHRWGGFAEAEFHSNGAFLTQYNYYEVKAGLSFDINPSYVALVGLNRNATYDFMDVGKGTIASENRIWEQLTISQYLYRLKIEHRYRAEQRWLNTGYRNRFDYRINVFVPLNNRRIVAKTWFISVANEVLLNTKEPNFEQNRASAALGYQFDRKWILQAGWLNLYNYIPNNSNAKNNMLIMLLYRINRNDGVHREHLPTTSG